MTGRPIEMALTMTDVKGLVNSTTAFELLNMSLHDFCRDFNNRDLFPLLEADVGAYLYHRLVENGCPLEYLFIETRVCGVTNERRRKYDLVMGDVQLESACVDPVLVAEIKCFQRWGHTPSQHRHRFQGILENDLESLEEASQVLPDGRLEIVFDLVSSPPPHGYLTGTCRGQERRKLLTSACQEVGVSLLWVRPNRTRDLEVQQLC